MHQKFLIKKLLKNNQSEHAYKDKLDVPNNVDSFMLDCRKTIRDKLRQDFSTYRENSASSLKSDENYAKSLHPKFFTQGSHAYKTQNLPCYSSQEIDLDDGVYFPMTFVQNNPAANKSMLVALVRQSLSDLSEQTGWPLSEKKMCFRLQVDKQIHIDVPVYAIPGDKYAQLTEARSAALNFAFKDEIIPYQRLDPTQVYVALLDDNALWHQSDPKQLHDWFISQTKRYPFLRNICRYLKAWRDYEWQEGGPSSIMLMVAAADALNKFPKMPESECEALLVVTKALPSIFAGDINNPIDNNENMFPSRCKDPAEILDIRERVTALSISYTQAVCEAQTKQLAVNTLISLFGERLPNREDWVQEKATPSAIRKKPVVAAAAITPSAARSHVSG
jgi:hypothetical protein